MNTVLRSRLNKKWWTLPSLLAMSQMRLMHFKKDSYVMDRITELSLDLIVNAILEHCGIRLATTKSVS